MIFKKSKPTSLFKKTSLLFLQSIVVLFSCQEIEDNPNSVLPEPLKIGGEDILNSNEFWVKLNADSLKKGEYGTWTIFKGLVEEKVYFEEASNPKSSFYGMPGEDYQLIWEVSSANKKIRDTVSVSFLPLQTEISTTLIQPTRIEVTGKMYDRGKWTILGDHQSIVNLGSTHYESPNESPYVRIISPENTISQIVWTTWYGSKSASDTVEFKSSEYNQDEALKSLGIFLDENLYKKNENGDVIEIVLLGDWRGYRFTLLKDHPELQALKHLERLILSGSAVIEFPEVITKYYHKLKHLHLSSENFGNLPEDFGNLKELDTLVISNVPNIGRLPESFGNLKKLKFLDMSHAGITHLPESFSELTNLDYLNLELNSIEKLPENFGNLKNLNTFRGPTLSQSIPVSFANLSSLEFCFFKVTDPTATLPSEIGKLTNLKTFWLSGNYQVLPESFSNLINLKDFQIGNTSGLKSLPQNFGNLQNLEMLHLTLNLDRLPESFGNLSKLKHLNLWGKLSFLSSSFGNLNSLESLSANNCDIKELPQSIGRLSNLKYITMVYNQLTEIPSSIGDLNQLHTLVLGRNRITKFPDTMAKLANNLKILAVNGNNYPISEEEKLKAMLPNTEIITRLEGD